MQKLFNLANEFIPLEVALASLAHADSSIQYAPHIRKEFDEVI